MNRLLYLKTCVCTSRRNLCTPAKDATPPSPDRLTPKYRPSEFQKLILVWTKKYKTTAEIPSFVSPELIEKSRSQARIKIANVLMLLTAMGSLVAIYLGKAAAKRGESIHTINQDFHKQYRENYEKQQTTK